MIYLCNAFSMHMLEWMYPGEKRHMTVTRLSGWEAGDLLRNNEFRSFYGHEQSAYHLSRYLRVRIPVSRGVISMGEGDSILVAAIDSKRNWEQGVRHCPGWHFFLVEYCGTSADDKTSQEDETSVECN